MSLAHSAPLAKLGASGVGSVAPDGALSAPSRGGGAAVASLLAFAACAWLRTSAEGAQRLFQAGNVLSTNHLSQIGSVQVDLLLGHLQLLLLGSGVLLLVEAVRRWLRPSSAGPVRGSRWLPLGVVLLAVLVLGSYAIRQQSALIDGVRFFYLKDDALTSMVYARHLLQGDGLVYNVGERVEGYTNLLWVLWMAAIRALGAGLRTGPFWVLASSWVCVACTIYFIFDLLRALKLSLRGSVACALCVAFDQNTWIWAVSGLETSALGAAVCGAVWALVRERRRGVALALTVVTLLRSDGFLLAAALGAIAFWYWRGRAAEPRRWLRAARPLVPALIATLAVFAFRLAYYGYPFPNTYYLKMIDLGDRLRVGLGGYGLRLTEAYPLPLALCLVAALARRSVPLVRAIALLVLFQSSYSLYVGGDIFRYLRFVAPVLPLLYAVACVTLEQLLARATMEAGALAQALSLAVCCVPCEGGQLGRLPEESGFFESELSLARLIEFNVPQGKLISVYPAGTIAYYAPGYRYLDVFGKNDEHIAHLSHYEGTAIGHNKSDFDYVYAERKPDVAFVVSPCDVIDEYLAAGGAARDRLRAAYSVDSTPVRFFDVGHPIFERDYYPGRVSYAGYPSPTPPECVFVRRGSDVPSRWAVPPPVALATSEARLVEPVAAQGRGVRGTTGS